MNNYLEYRDEKSAKFWEVIVNDKKLILRWGKIDTTGQSKEKSFDSHEKAITEAEKLTSQKLSEGYTLTYGDSQKSIEKLKIKSISNLSVQSNQLSFEGLKDRWLQNSFPSINKENFKEKFRQLLDETMQRNTEFSPQVRSEIISNMFKFYNKHLTYPGRYYKSVANSARKLLKPAIIEVLEPGFEGEEITEDLLGKALNYDILDAMFKAGINPNSKFQSDIASAADNKEQFFFRFVEEGAKLDLLIDGEIRSSLVKYKFLKTIYEKGVNLNVLDNKGRNPLFFAGNDFQATNLLIQAGCDINQVNEDGDTVLSQYLRRSSGDYGIKVCKNLINVGASLLCPPNTVPLITLIPKDKPYYYEDDIFKTVDFLINKKVTLNQNHPVTGNTPLHYWAGADGKISRKVCLKLLEAGAEINALNNKGQTPLMYAAEMHSTKSWKLLLSKKADINARSYNGYSICEWAVSQGKEPTAEFLKVLLESKNLKPTSEGPSDLSLLGFLIHHYHYDAAIKLIEKGWVINDYIITTIANQMDGDMMKAIKNVAEFITTVGSLGMDALDSEHLDNINKQCEYIREAAITGDNENIFPRVWPPVFAERQLIIVDKLEVVTQPLDTINYTDASEEQDFASYGEKLSIWESSNRSRKKLKQAKENNNWGFLKYNHGELFNLFLLADDETLVAMWNDFMGKDINIFYTSRKFPEYYDGARFGSNVREEELKYILYRCGVKAIPGMLHASRKKLNMVCKAFMPVSSSIIAPFMASLLIKTTVSRYVKKWLLRHPKHAIHGLIPLAVGNIGKNREHCESALRYMACNGHNNLIVEISNLYGKECKDAVNEILSVDYAFDYHGESLPKMPEKLIDGNVLPPVLNNSGKRLNEADLLIFYGMMSLSKYDDIYPGLEKILPLFDAKSLSEFSLSVFDLWENWTTYSWKEDEKKLKKEAEWMYHCLAFMGDDDTVKKLIPYISALWPKAGGMPKAVIGLEILAIIGSDLAIRSINQILLKTKYKPLLERADDIMNTIADLRGLTKAELDDRLVPTFGLDDKDSFILDFGVQKFTIQFNERLVPSLLNLDNTNIKNLPKPAKTDDKTKAKEVTEFWKNFKVDLKKEATTQLLRFEQAMLTSRTWIVNDFKTHLVTHPILCRLVRNLVWAVIKNDNTIQLFIIDTLGNFLDAESQKVILFDDDRVFIPHPLKFQSAIETWKDYLVKHKIKQPFPQITRQIYLKNDKNKDFFGINGAKAPAKAFRGLKSKGWLPEIGGGGTIWSYEKTLSDANVIIYFEGVVTMFEEGIDEDQTLEISISGEPSDLELSEIVREIKDLIH